MQHALWFQALKLNNLSVSSTSEPQTSKDTYRNPFSVFSSAQVGPLDSSSSSFSSTDLLRQTRKAISNFLIDLIANFRLQPLERKHRQLGGDPPARHSAVQHGRMKAACGTAAPQQHAQQVFAFSQQLISEPANSEQRPASGLRARGASSYLSAARSQRIKTLEFPDTFDFTAHLTSQYHRSTPI